MAILTSFSNNNNFSLVSGKVIVPEEYNNTWVSTPEVKSKNINDYLRDQEIPF